MRSRKSILFILAGVGSCLAIGSCGAPLDLSPDTLPNGAVGQGYSQVLSTDFEGDTRWEIVEGALPAGVELGYDSGVLSGTPTQAGDFQFTVRATGSGLDLRSGEMAYTMTVLERLVLDASLATGRVGEAYSDTLSASGGLSPYTYEVIGLPAGIGLNSETGAISGTPIYAIPGDLLQVTVRDSGQPQQEVTETITFVVKPAPVQIATETLPDAGIGSTNYSVTLEAEGGTSPYTWAIVDGFLKDAGLELVLSTGEIRNRRDANHQPIAIPANAVAVTFSVQVTDSDSPATVDTREFTIAVDQPAD